MRRTDLYLTLAMLLCCAPALAADKWALLVGCSHYEHNSAWALPGSKNDVLAFEHLLAERFGFDHIEKLVDWPDAEQARPTAQNITAAFERLIDEASPGSHVFVLLSGHGQQFPVLATAEAQDSKNTEPDGMDEAFLAADYHAGKNLIRDDQIGMWLDRLVHQKHAHVWIVFDSCFSGTMTRGGLNSEFYQPRTITSNAAGVPAPTATGKSAHSRGPGQAASRLLETTPRSASTEGSYVAFYAAQEFETEADVVRPLGADPSNPANRHGLLAYHLEQLLKEQLVTFSYDDLGRALVSRYRAEGRARPTPMWEGELDRQVFGLDNWPTPSPILLEKADRKLRLTGGRLAWLTPNTIVAAFALGDKAAERPLAYFRVSNVTLTNASVEPVSQGNTPAKTIDEIPDDCFCRVISQDLSASKIRLKLALPDQYAHAAEIRESMQRHSKDPAAVFEIVDGSQSADWVLKITAGARDDDPPDAAQAFLLAADTSEQTQSTAGAVHAQYAISPDTMTDTAAQVADDLKKIAVWHNLWRLTSAYAAPSPYVDRQHIALEVQRVDAPNLQETERIATSSLRVGDSVSLRLKNTSLRSHWYFVLYLNGRYAIKELNRGSIAGRDPTQDRTAAVWRKLSTFTINEASVGTNGIVVIAMNQREHRQQPNYGFLCQSGIGEPATRAIPDLSSLETPFDQVILASTDGRHRMRSQADQEQPQLAAWSWVTLSDQR